MPGVKFRDDWETFPDGSKGLMVTVLIDGLYKGAVMQSNIDGLWKTSPALRDQCPNMPAEWPLAKVKDAIRKRLEK